MQMYDGLCTHAWDIINCEHCEAVEEDGAAYQCGHTLEQRHEVEKQMKILEYCRKMTNRLIIEVATSVCVYLYVCVCMCICIFYVHLCCIQCFCVLRVPET